MKPFFVLAAMLAFFSCESTSSESGDRKDGYSVVLKTKEDSLYHEVMQGHDVGMAKMGKLRKHLKQVQHALDSVTKLSTTKIDEPYRRALTDLQKDLNHADHSMYKWMEEFKADSAKDNQDKRLAYLESEKVKVQKVKENILTSLEKADSMFKK